jgi:hypothetical protein
VKFPLRMRPSQSWALTYRPPDRCVAGEFDSAAHDLVASVMKGLSVFAPLNGIRG